MINLCLYFALLFLNVANYAHASIISEQFNQDAIRQNPIFSTVNISGIGMVEMTQDMADAERLYLEGKKFNEEARIYEGFFGNHPIRVKEEKARESALQYFKEAASKGHIGAKVLVEKYNQDRYPFTDYGSDLYQFSSTYDHLNDGQCVLASCIPELCIPIVGQFIAIEFNKTTEEQIKQTHASFDKKINELSEWESLIQDPVLKMEIPKLKDRLKKSRDLYDEKASKVFRERSYCTVYWRERLGEEDCLCCPVYKPCNYKFRDASAIK